MPYCTTVVQKENELFELKMTPNYPKKLQFSAPYRQKILKSLDIGQSINPIILIEGSLP